MRALALFALLGLAACARQEPPPPPGLSMDCKQGFESLAKAIAGEPGLTVAHEAGEPYLYYRPEGGGASYVVTEQGSPGHPAVIKQEAQQVNGKKAMVTTGCPYGDRKGYAEVLAYLQGLARPPKQ